MDRTRKLWNLLLCSFWLLLPKLYFYKGDWELTSAFNQFKIFLLLSCFLRSSVWSCLGDKSFDKRFCRILQSCYHCRFVIYLGASYFRNFMACTPSYKMGWKNVSHNLMIDQKIFISKRGCSMERVNFLKRVQRIFGESRKLHNCTIIKNASRIPYALRLIRGIGITH